MGLQMSFYKKFKQTIPELQNCNILTKTGECNNNVKCKDVSLKSKNNIQSSENIVIEKFNGVSLINGQTNETINNLGISKQRDICYPSETQSEYGGKRRKVKRINQRSHFNNIQMEDFLNECSLESPANISMVLGCSTILYRTNAAYIHKEEHLPLGMVVNGLFKNSNWLYIQTPHGKEGYVIYGSCIALGIPPQKRTQHCWDSSTDIFPLPKGTTASNIKEYKRERRIKSAFRSYNTAYSECEKSLDYLYIKSVTKPKILRSSIGQLRNTDMVINHQGAANKEKVQFERRNKHMKIKREILMCISKDFQSPNITVKQGEVVILLATKQIYDQYHINKQDVFHIRCRDGTEGFIPFDVAGYGYL